MLLLSNSTTKDTAFILLSHPVNSGAPFILQISVQWGCINVFWQGHYEYFRYLGPAVTRGWYCCVDRVEGSKRFMSCEEWHCNVESLFTFNASDGLTSYLLISYFVTCDTMKLSFWIHINLIHFAVYWINFLNSSHFFCSVFSFFSQCATCTLRAFLLLTLGHWKIRTLPRECVVT